MQVSIPNTFVLDIGEYGADVRRANGQPIRYVEVYDRDQPQQRAVRLTIAEDVDPEKLPPVGAVVDVEGVVMFRDGKAKLRADELRPAKPQAA